MRDPGQLEVTKFKPKKCKRCRKTYRPKASNMSIKKTEKPKTCKLLKGANEMIENKKAYKYDQNKPRLDLVPPSLIEAVGIVRTYGVSKYRTVNGWQKVEPERYTAALMRHLCKFLRDPEGRDEESELPHLWHMACNIAFLIELYGGVKND